MSRKGLNRKQCHLKLGELILINIRGINYVLDKSGSITARGLYDSISFVLSHDSIGGLMVITITYIN